MNARKRSILAVVPFLLGAAVSIGLNATGRAPLLRIIVDLGTVLFGLGLVISLGAAAALAVQALLDQVRREMAADANHERRRFLRRLDHELKNPLTAILAGLANLDQAVSGPPDAVSGPPDAGESGADRGGPGGEREAALNSVTVQVQRLRRLVTELRKLSDLETRELDREAVDMTLLLEEVFGLAQSQPGATSRRLSLSIPRAPWPLPAVSGDRDLLFLAVYNPLDNALKFSQPQDTIELRATENDGWVAIEIADTGPGIPEDEVGLVWEELYRGKGARGVPGSGLGLALARAIVIRHGGQATIRSRSGQGTQVSLRLPINPR